MGSENQNIFTVDQEAAFLEDRADDSGDAHVSAHADTRIASCILRGM